VEDSDTGPDSLSERDKNALDPDLWESPEHLARAARLAGMSDGQDREAAQFMTGMLICYKVSRLTLPLFFEGALDMV
jgi:hypothetical protein